MAYIIQHNIASIKPHNRTVKLPAEAGSYSRGRYRNRRVNTNFETVQEAITWVKEQSVLFFKKYPQDTFRMAIIDCDTLEQIERVELTYNPKFSSF